MDVIHEEWAHCNMGWLRLFCRDSDVDMGVKPPVSYGLARGDPEGKCPYNTGWPILACRYYDSDIRVKATRIIQIGQQ